MTEREHVLEHGRFLPLQGTVIDLVSYGIQLCVLAGLHSNLGVNMNLHHDSYTHATFF